MGGMAAATGDADVPAVRGRQQRAALGDDVADRNAGLLWIAKTASQGNFSNSPSSIITFAPPPPSSAGWKIKWTAPSKFRVSLSIFAAPSSMAVWPSWPQACMRPDSSSGGELVGSSIGRQSMSARRPIDFSELPLRSVPTSPVLPSPRVTSRPHSCSLAATTSEVRFSSKASSG